MEFANMIRLATRLLGQGTQIDQALTVLAGLRRALDQTQQQPPEESEHKEGSVAWLQDSLNKLNNAGLAVDGDYGPATKKAVSDYQKEHGLAVDGWAGPQTVAAIMEDLERA